MADLCFIFCVVPFIDNMVAHNGKQGYGLWGCFLHGFAIVISAAASLVAMGLIAFSRYVFIVHPRKKSFLSWTVCGVMCVSCWRYAILLMVPALLGWGLMGWVPRGYACGYDWLYNMFVFAFGLVSTFTSFCYYKIYNAVRVPPYDGREAEEISQI